MRIISGKYKGRNIPVRKDFPSRPTTDFAKENLFNVLANQFDFAELHVLDLFSGTGSISYEFASRGCKKIVAVEKDYRSFSFIRNTVKQLEFDEIVPVKMEAFKYLDKSTEKFDIVFADPPYNLPDLDEIPQKVLESEIISKNGWLILEHGKKNQFNGFQNLIDVRRYGSVHFSIFKP
jgi:16S rRNA (guanine966-N2)-methyltransferase